MTSGVLSRGGFDLEPQLTLDHIYVIFAGGRPEGASILYLVEDRCFIDVFICM